MSTRSNFHNLWGQPIIIGLMTLTGLILALIGEGLYDWVACALLLYPMVKLVYHYWIKAKNSTSQ